MKLHQLQQGKVPGRLWTLNLGLIALALLAFAVACGDSTPTPTPTPTASPVPTPSPAPITANPEEDPTAFLQAIPAGERECMVQAFGTENLFEVIGAGPPSSEDRTKLMDCLSEETARRMMLGSMMEGDIGEQGVACLSAELSDVSFLENLIPSSDQGMETSTFPFQLNRAMLNCLSDEEAAGWELLGGQEVGGPSMTQIRCLYESADDDTIAELFSLLGGIAQGAPAPQEILAKCDLPLPMPGEGGGPPQLTPEQEDCVIEAIGETAHNELFTGQRPPTMQEIQKIEECGVPVGPSSDAGPGTGGRTDSGKS